MTSASGPDEDDVLASLIDLERFARVFERRVREIHRYVALQTNRSVAEELTAEVFLQAFTTRAAYDPKRATVRAWLYGIATNVVRRHCRSEHQKRSKYALLLQETPVQPGPDETELSEQPEKLLAALRLLSPKLREVVVLVAGAELTYEQAAAALGIPVGTVRSRYSRARTHLRRTVDRSGRSEALRLHLDDVSNAKERS